MALRLRVVSDHRRSLGDRGSIVFGVGGGTIGRSADNDWVLPDPARYVSAHHARVSFKEGGYLLEDLSTNGVYVNGGLVDSKYQFYPPHASLPYSKAPGGSNVFISVQHLYFTWAIVPRFIPEFGWTFTAAWVPGIAYGTLSCIAPFRGL